jgi:predicted SAM-dependent methyltransferase
LFLSLKQHPVGSCHDSCFPRDLLQEKRAMNELRVNVGCGQSPTKGWRNFDNSPSLYLSKMSPLLPTLLTAVGLLRQEQFEFIQFCRKNSIEHGNAVKGLPLGSGSVEALYSSHMIEHLDRYEAVLFLKEARRVLRHGGIIRLAVPDIRMRAEEYVREGDADQFIASTNMARPRPRKMRERLSLLIIGTRQHQWMYDGASLSRLLLEQGFISPEVLKSGETRIHEPANLNLQERCDESVYVEAINP